MWGGGRGGGVALESALFMASPGKAFGPEQPQKGRSFSLKEDPQSSTDGCWSPNQLTRCVLWTGSTSGGLARRAGMWGTTSPAQRR